MSEYTQGISEDGAAILRDGKPLTVEEILTGLRLAETAVKGRWKAEHALNSINDICWTVKGRGKDVVAVSSILDVIEKHEAD